MTFELNDQQEEVIDLSEKWYRADMKQTFEISGPAGSGKTTIVKILSERLGLEAHNVLYMAYVGKAAMMLALKGNFAKTIHSSIYDVVQVPRFDAEGNFMKKNGRIVTMLGFEKKKQLHSDIKLIVVDEGSMLNQAIAEDVLSYGIPVIVLGDLNQLPPVFGDPYFLNRPDYILTKVMRQKEDDPIIKLSQMAIRGERIRPGKYGPKCFVIGKELINDNLLKNSDIIICGKNSTRQNINDHYRRNLMGVTEPRVPVFGDKIICRQNNWKLSLDGSGIFLINGLIGYIDGINLESFDKKSIKIDFRPEFLQDEKFENITMDFDYLFQPVSDPTTNRFNMANKFQFAYAITAHLAQGSQYDKVLIYNEKIGSWDYYRKWLYTAITRAVSGLVLAV